MLHDPSLGQEALNLAPMHMLHWSSWEPGAAPDDLSLSSFWPNTIEVWGIMRHNNLINAGWQTRCVVAAASAAVLGGCWVS